ncbi:MAG: hypothetical protein LC776_10105 [Acidobacteria bacterium]|nr:hypothetical protein [Acidobacteriota bacterium]
MSGDNFEATPWWELPDGEKPVPLGPGHAWEAADEAELIVNVEREAIIREDTEPSLVTLAQLAAAAEPQVSRAGIAVSRPTALVAAGILLLGCAAMFALGWRQGKEILASRATSSSVMQPTLDEHLGGSVLSSVQFKNDVRKGEKG